MEWFDSLSDWAAANSTALWWLFAVTLAFLLLTPLVAGWFIIQLPTDYFAKEQRRPLASWDEYPAVRWVMLIAKNLLGALILIAGVAMLIGPGQGLLAIVVGLMLVDFPGKFRLQKSLVTRSRIWQSINWLRKRAHKPELKRPD